MKGIHARSHESHICFILIAAEWYGQKKLKLEKKYY